MSSIIRRGDTYHGISVECRGVFKHKYGNTYAGQIRDGHACGLGVTTWSDGTKVYAEHGPDGQFDGRRLGRFANGDTWYDLYERGGKQKADAFVSAGGRCQYNDEDCAPDDPRLLALIALVGPVEVRPAAQAPHPPSARHSDPTQSSDGSAGSFCPSAGAREDRGHRGAFPRRTPSLVAVRHNPTPATATMLRTIRQRRVHGPFCRSGRTRDTLLDPDIRRRVRTRGPSRQRHCHAIPSRARRRTERCHARLAALCMSPCTRHPHTATFRCTPIPHRAPAVRPRRFARVCRGSFSPEPR